MTVGKKNPKKKNKTILLVGETGTGKSTLINALVNYAMGVKWKNKVWFQIIEEEKKSQTESQTSDVIVYEIFGFEGKALPYSLTIIDTPGYGDTRGSENDNITSERLLDLFSSKEGVHEVHAVGLVMKASVNRVSDRLIYIFDSVVSLFGKDMEKNILALITHSDGRAPKNALEALEVAKMKCARNENNEPVYFLFDNCQHEDRKEDEKLLKHAAKSSKTGMRKFTAFLEQTAGIKMAYTVEVMNERVILKACIENLRERIKCIELEQKKIKETQEDLDKHKQKMRKNEDFITERNEVYKRQEHIARQGLVYDGALCCTACEETCHFRCTLAPIPEQCGVIKKGFCKVCTNKCSVSKHVKVKWRYVTETRRVTQTDEDKKLKYDKNKSESENKSSLLENLEEEMKKLTAQKSQLLDESYQHVVKLEQIALKADSLSTIAHLSFLIEKMKEEGDIKKVQKLEEMKSKVDPGTRAAQRYKHDNEMK